MSLLVYSAMTNAAEEKFLRVTELLLQLEKIIICPTIEALSDELRQPHLSPRIVVLFTSTREDLDAILSIRVLLEDAKIILIVPDMEPETVARGHTLRPRFLSTCNSDFADIIAVLSQMIKKLQHN